MIELYTAGTPNGWKVSIALEELEIPYQTHHIDLMNGAQKTPEFLAINPNGRIPAIVDREHDDLAIFESGAILIHLAEKSGALYGSDLASSRQVLSWLMFQMGGIGPMMGQANVFYRYFPEKIDAAIARFHGETRRLFEVLDGQLAKTEYLAGDYSIADIANWSWVRCYGWGGMNIDGLDHLHRWMAAIEERPAVQKGVRVPSSEGWDMLMGPGDNADEFTRQALNLVTTK